MCVGVWVVCESRGIALMITMDVVEASGNKRKGQKGNKPPDRSQWPTYIQRAVPHKMKKIPTTSIHGYFTLSLKTA